MTDKEEHRAAARAMAKHCADFLGHLTTERLKYEAVRSWMGIHNWDREWSDERYADLVSMAATEPEAYWVARREAADLLLNNEPIPFVLSNFAQDVLLGELDQPKKAGRPRSHEDLKLSYIYRFTSEMVCPPILRRFRNSETDDKNTACDYMTEALFEASKAKPPEQRWNREPSFINDLFKKKQYEHVRILADKLTPPKVG